MRRASRSTRITLANAIANDLIATRLSEGGRGRSTVTGGYEEWLRAFGVSVRPMKRWRLIIHLRSSLWFVPVLCVLAGAAISFGTIALDRAFEYEAFPRAWSAARTPPRRFFRPSLPRW